jgi:hypothetical protein
MYHMGEVVNRVASRFKHVRQDQCTKHKVAVPVVLLSKTTSRHDERVWERKGTVLFGGLGYIWAGFAAKLRPDIVHSGGKVCHPIKAVVRLKTMFSGCSSSRLVFDVFGKREP